MPVEPYKPLYTVKQAAKVLLVSPCTVYELINNGKLDALLIGSKKIRGSDLEKFIEGQKPEKPGGGETECTTPQ